MAGERMPISKCHAILARIRAHQQNNAVHPLTCGNDGRHVLQGQLMPDPAEHRSDNYGEVILVCPDCDYRQSYLPSFLLTDHGEGGSL
jgi:hypothetical protein